VEVSHVLALCLAPVAQVSTATGAKGWMEWEKQRAARGGKANYHLIAVLSAELGDTDAAFQSLEKAYQDRLLTMPNIKVAPGLRSLHGDPRFADLVRRVGLPP
jgi:hypothetical protein